MRAAMFTFDLVPDEGEELTVEADSRDIVRWERETGKAFSSFADGTVEMSTFYHLAFLAGRRRGLLQGVGKEGVEALIDGYALVITEHNDAPEGEGALDPTQPAASTAPPSS